MEISSVWKSQISTFPNSQISKFVMRLFAVSISHRTAPVELRESVDFSRRGLEAALEALGTRNLAREAVVVSTCNRAEIYAAAESTGGAESCGRFIADYNGLPWDTVAPHVVTYRGAHAADHLFRVAAGLDSLVVGEPQILGQVKDAYAAASGLKTTGALTNRLFTSAFTRRQARPQRDAAGRRRRLGQLRGDRAGPEDLRRAQGPERADSSAPARWPSSPACTCRRRR